MSEAFKKHMPIVFDTVLPKWNYWGSPSGKANRGVILTPSLSGLYVGEGNPLPTPCTSPPNARSSTSLIVSANQDRAVQIPDAHTLKGERTGRRNLTERQLRLLRGYEVRAGETAAWWAKIQRDPSN